MVAAPGLLAADVRAELASRIDAAFLPRPLVVVDTLPRDANAKLPLSTLREMVETVGRMIDLQPVIETEARLPAPVPVNYISDLSRIKAELGWQPLIGIEEGLRSLL